MSIQRFEKGTRMSQAVVLGNTIYLAGQVGRGENVAEQTSDMLTEVDRCLALVGSTKSHILQATIWLADMTDFAKMNRIWDAWIDPENPPARACGEARLATPEYKVEVIVVAAMPL